MRWIILIILIVILILVVSILLFLKYGVTFGGKITKEDKEDYKKRCSNYKNNKFYNKHEFKKIYKDVEENKYMSSKGIVPIEEIPVLKPCLEKKPKVDLLTITWLGHSSILMQMHGMNILIDPVFSNRTSPISFVGPKRFSHWPIKVNDLPNIDIVIITHDHFDHLDYKTIKALSSKVDKFIVPLGIEKHLERWKIAKNKIIKMSWWEEIKINGLTIGCTPGRHYSSRNFIFDSFNTLWASWVLMDEYHKVFDSGDTGFDNHFEEIYTKYGEFDLALVDAGQYNTKWKSTHMIPEEAVQTCEILKSKVAMPIHWGAYFLANHPWDDTVERFSVEADKKRLKYITPKIGETITYDKKIKTDKWWQKIK